MSEITIPCPFVYANGAKCQGHVCQARAYGPTRGGNYVARERVRKYRLWCSAKDNHEGILSSMRGKLRMEFYPDQLPPGVEDQLWAGSLLDRRGRARR